MALGAYEDVAADLVAIAKVQQFLEKVALL
jgi:hypothetical protein